MLRRIAANSDIDRYVGGAAVAGAEIDRLGARKTRMCRCFTVVEIPVAGGALRHVAGKMDDDGMVARRQIIFADIVAVAGLADLAGLIDAQPAEHVARPPAA